MVAPFPESPFRSWGHLAAGMSLFWLGRLVEADRELEQSFAFYDVEEQGPVVMKYGQDCGATSLGYLAVLSWALGRPDRGLAQANEAVALAQRLSHAHTSAVAMSMAAATHQLRREPGPARERAEAAVALSTEHVLPMWRSWGTVLRGWARCEAGDGDDAIEELRSGISAWRSLGSELAAPWFLTLLAEALDRHGRVDEGLATVDEALSLTARTHDRWYEPESHRVHGLLLAREKRLPEAEAALRRAVELAREREATGFELRAAVALGRFLAETDGATRLAGSSATSSRGAPRASTPPTSPPRARCSPGSAERCGSFGPTLPPTGKGEWTRPTSPAFPATASCSPPAPRWRRSVGALDLDRVQWASLQWTVRCRAQLRTAAIVWASCLCPLCEGRRRIVAVYPGGPRRRDLLDRLGFSPPPLRIARRPSGARLSTPPPDRAPALPSGSAPPGAAALPRPLARPASAPGPRRHPLSRAVTPLAPELPSCGPPPRSDGVFSPSRLRRRDRRERGEGWPQAAGTR